MFLLGPIYFDCDSRAPGPVTRPRGINVSGTSETFTSTQPTPAFTGTPTFLDQTPSITPFDTANTFPGVTAAPAVGVPTLGPPDVSFTDIRISANQVFWGSYPPASTLVSAQVAGTVPVEQVLVAVRLENPKTFDTTPWGGYAIMEDAGAARFYLSVDRAVIRPLQRLPEHLGPVPAHGNRPRQTGDWVFDAVPQVTSGCSMPVGI